MTFRYCALMRICLILLLCLSASLMAIDVQLGRDVDEQISDDDTLQDVFPSINTVLTEGRITPSFVDGKPQNNRGLPIKGNSVVLTHETPVYVTWDLGQNHRVFDKSQLDGVTLWLVGVACKKMDTYQQHKPNFVGQLSVSVDGKNFTPIKGTKVNLIAPDSKEFNMVRWKFMPGEVVGFRYLRLESFGTNGESSRVAEIDGWISGITVPKSTDLETAVKALTPDKITYTPPTRSEADPLPAVTHPLRFANNRLVMADNGTALLDMSSATACPDSSWKIVSRVSNKTGIKVVMRRADGLIQTREFKISDNNLMTLECTTQLPQDAKPANYTQTDFVFDEADVKYDGCTLGGIPAFIERMKPVSVEIGDWVPYLIFPSHKLGIELQMFMPAWYNVAGRMKTYSANNLFELNLFAGVQNTRKELNNTAVGLDLAKWHPFYRTLQPGEKISYILNFAAFDITPMTIGQHDIETSRNNPLVFIDTGVPNQVSPGVTTILFRDKMEFMGFKLPAPLKEKIGHLAVDTAGTYASPALVERMQKAGFGVAVLMGDEYVDVSHGISSKGIYGKKEPHFDGVIKDLTAHGIKPLCWFSPRGFLNQRWLDRPKDRLIDQHPDWFVSGAHWFGRYQTLDSFNKDGNQWVIDKMLDDLKSTPELKGFAFDSFPMRGCLVGDNEKTTLTEKEQFWLRQFSKTVREEDLCNLLVANSVVPMYNDSLSYDYIVTEHYPLMFLNQVLGGRAFGKTFIAHCQWQQLYGWYVTLGHMHYNFCDYDQALGWMHNCWLGLLDDQVATAYKKVDDEVVPLWYIMGKGRRIYSAEIAPNVRQIEVLMPDNSRFIVISSISPYLADVQIVPQTITPDKYTIEISADNCFRHSKFELEVDMKNTPAFELNKVSPFSITVMRFKKADGNVIGKN